MAGIGFELRKLFNKKGFISNISAYFYSALITVGPMIISICMIVFAKLYLSYLGKTQAQFELLMATIVYCFISSMLLTGGFVFILSRFVSDQIFTNEKHKILPSFYGAIMIVVVLAAIVGSAFVVYSPLDISYKVIAYLLFTELSILWVETVYLSTLKDYVRILIGFLCAACITILLSIVFVSYFSYDTITLILISMTLGFLFTDLLFGVFIRKVYPAFKTGIFEFLKYICKYFSLFLIGFFLTSAIYIHNFVFWASDNRVVAGNTFIYCPMYDVPVFFSILTIIPAMVIFIVSVETNFYSKYRLYYSAILNGGTINEIKLAKKEMMDVLSSEIAYIIEVQLFTSIVSIALGMKFLPRMGFTEIAINMLSMLVLASFVYVAMYVIVLLMLYFDDRMGALVVAVVFFVCNLVFTLITLYLGENFYGTGYFAAGFIALIIALGRFSYFLKNIDYYTFCRQSLVADTKESIFSRLIGRLSSRI